MPSPLVFRFVNGIIISPTVRMNLDDGSMWRLQADSRFDPPKAKRARVSTMLTDGARYPASAYDDRVLTLHWVLETDTVDQAADQIQDLIRELDRPGGNILEYRPPSATSPVFFRTIRLALDTIDMPTDGTLHDLRVPIIAEPFGYGLLETPVDAASINRDPAGASNPTYVDITGVKGDVETPAMIKWPVASAGATRETVFAVRRRGTPANAPFLIQAESMTQANDTATQANDANFSGAGNNYSRCSFTSNPTVMNVRLSSNDLPGVASVDLRGRYKVWLRYRKNTSTDGINVQLVWGTSGGVATSNTIVALPNTTSTCMAYLGEIQVPRGWDPIYEGRSGVELATTDVFYLAVQAQRASGSGTLDLDFLRLMPADDVTFNEKLAIVKWNEAPSGADHWWLDADDNNTHARDSSGRVISAAAPSTANSLPYLSPGQTNRLHILHETAAGNSSDLSSTTISVSYYPRYLYIRPATT